MALHIIHGVIGVGKTLRCMDILKQGLGIYDKIYYIVPEQFSYTAEEMVTRNFGASSPALVEVISFKRLYYNMINQNGDSGLKKLTIGGKTILLNYICLSLKNKLSILGKSARYKGFAEVMTTLLSEFKTYNVTPETISNVYGKLKDNDKLSLKLRDLELIYSAYSNLIENKFSDADDELGLLAGLIKKFPEIYCGGLFVFDGFSGFTPQEFEVISSLMGCARDIYFAFTCDKLEISGLHDIFNMQKKNITRLFSLADIAGVDIAPVENLNIQNKYDDCPDIKFLIQNIASHSHEKYIQNVNNIRITAHNNQYDEIEFVAEEISKLVRNDGLRYKDILIIVRDSDRYLSVIRKIFKSFEIPVFISDRVNAASHPAIMAIISALEIIAYNFSYESVFSYLKSGFANLDYYELDLLENYIIATGIRGNSWTSEKDWHYTPYMAKDYDDENIFLNVVNSIRRKFVHPIKNLKEALDSSRTIKEKCFALYEFILEIQLFDNIQGMIERYKTTNPQASSYYGQVWNILISTLDEIVDILGDTEADFTEFKDILITGLSVHEIGVIPTTTDVVTTVNAENANGNYKTVFIVGVNEGIYPSVMNNEGLLCDNDRIKLKSLGVELARDTVSKAFDEDYILYSALGTSTNKLFITYPVSDMSGSGRHPARIIRRCTDLFEKIEVEDLITPSVFLDSDKISRPIPTFLYFIDNMRKEKEGMEYNKLWHDVGIWFENNMKDKFEVFQKAISYTPCAVRIDENLINEFFKDGTLKTSVSRLELYKKCPFAHYVSYMLKLQTRQEAKLDMTDTGSIMHDILDKLSKILHEKGFSWQSVPDDFLIKETELLVEIKISEIESKFDYKSNRRIWMLARLKNTLLSSVEFIARHLRAGEFVPLGYEIEFDDNKKYTPLTIDLGGRKIKLRGKIDRADIYENAEGERYIRVIDYKSGSRNFDIAQMYYGLQLQLAVYLDRLCELENANPAGILYFRLHDPNPSLLADSSDEEIENSLAKEYQMKGLVLSDDNIIKAMDKCIQGSSRVIPVKYKDNRELDRFSSVANCEQFIGIRKKLNKIITLLVKEIADGHSEILPFKYNNMTGCTYCDYKEVCHFDTGCGSKYNALVPFPKEEIWRKILKEGKENA